MRATNRHHRTRDGLNRYPENYFAEVEQAAFSPANIVPGIGFSPDKMLQGRLFSYGDTQRYRLGINFNHIPVNAPKCPFQSYHRDGKMRADGNLGNALTFTPNSAGLWDNQPDFAEPPMPIEGDGAHWDHRVDDDHWEQPGNLFRKMTPAQQQLLLATVEDMTGSIEAIVFPKTYPQIQAAFVEDTIVTVKGRLRTRERRGAAATAAGGDAAQPELTVAVSDVTPFQRYEPPPAANAWHVTAERREQIDALAQLLEGSPGPVPVVLHVGGGSRRMAVGISNGVFVRNSLEEIFSRSGVREGPVQPA